ncbi:hypothetical protein V5F77_04250 [Xanthobacter sp. DSM 24535]|uniref:hypothetical protein n=1 Tax=Roseixanthobacter psychrophilus TaxID=3119917 RepID=UPI00372739D9
MTVPSPHIAKQIEDKLRKLGASEVERIEIMSLVEDIHKDSYGSGYEQAAKDWEDGE